MPREFTITDESNHNGPCFAIREDGEWICWSLTREEAEKYARLVLQGEVVRDCYASPCALQGHAVNPQSFNSVRSYFFRLQCAEIERDFGQFGGRPLDAFTLDNFRLLWAHATHMAIDHERARTNRYNPKTRSWDFPFINN